MFSEKLLKIPLFGPSIHQLRLLGAQQHPQGGVYATSTFFNFLTYSIPL
jgi:hypothetical protein